MEATLASIRARSQRRAMDWSLVLASQGIEAVIQYLPEGGGWVLLVEPHELERALAAIRQYRLENRGWAWRQPLAWSGLTFHWGALLWCWVMALFYWLSEAIGPSIDAAAAMDSVAVRQGEWWRLFTAVCLHADVGHLAANVCTGFLVLGLAMARCGAGRALLGALLAGAGGNLAGLLLHLKPYHGLGASGMVMGGLGLLAAQSVPLLPQRPHAFRQALIGLLGGLLLFILMGFNPASDVVAHLGGFVSGILLGTGLAWLPAPLRQNAKVDRVAGALAAGLTVVTWTLALWRGRPLF
jgi:membrane associated rhomboid family serine protease